MKWVCSGAALGHGRAGDGLCIFFESMHRQLSVALETAEAAGVPHLWGEMHVVGCGDLAMN